MLRIYVKVGYMYNFIRLFAKPLVTYHYSVQPLNPWECQVVLGSVFVCWC